MPRLAVRFDLCAVCALVLVLTTLAVQPAGARTSAQESFDNASLSGTYASRAVARGGHRAAVAYRLYNFNGDGTFSGASVVSAPGMLAAERGAKDVEFTGQYRVDEHGFGSGSIMYTGMVEWETGFHFVVNRGSRVGSSTVAQDVSLSLDELGPNTGGLITEELSRLPDGAAFTNASLSGTFVSTAHAHDAQRPAISYREYHFNPDGTLTGQLVANGPGMQANQRAIKTSSFSGRYTLDERGMASGTIVFTGMIEWQTSFHLVVTKATPGNSGAIATEIVLNMDELGPMTGGLIIETLQRR